MTPTLDKVLLMKCTLAFLVRVFNVTKKRRITASCRKANPYLGLMFQIPHPVVFLFGRPRNVSLHMFFVWGSIDVLYLRKGVVVEKKENFRPWTFFFPRELADTVIELPAGMASMTAVGDKLRLD